MSSRFYALPLDQTHWDDLHANDEEVAGRLDAARRQGLGEGAEAAVALAGLDPERALQVRRTIDAGQA